ncbi:MAG: peptidoglycan DD-metalloendopeptidase family protein [Anaerolineales bacterium]|nr:peptidoglycan DD-metalloendopeptidase family protein [Chloroflexota bacterium]MBL6979566.1 peptidoglycan DD-metalloendopeptidase family protein [Anaerolineales bacterium]
MQITRCKLHVYLSCFLIAAAFFAGLSACAPVEEEQLTVTSDQLSGSSTQYPIPSFTPSSTLPSTPTPQPPTPTPLPPTPTPCPPDICIYAGHFDLMRPISTEFVDVVDPTYRYGSTQGGQRETHHGVEFVNSQGTPVLAATDGVVIVAGNDYQTPYADVPGFYGNLVIIEHTLPKNEEPVFTLYGHLYEIHVEIDQQVNAGEPLGTVGFTGWAVGEHLHFEVRYGENSYRKTRNPELWLQPHDDENGRPHGTIAGQILDEFGSPIPIVSISVEQLSLEGDEILSTYYIESYADWTVNGDNDLGENFVISDLPTGKYRLSFVARGLQVYEVDVLPGQVTLISFDAREQGE